LSEVFSKKRKPTKSGFPNGVETKRDAIISSSPVDLNGKKGTRKGPHERSDEIARLQNEKTMQQTAGRAAIETLNMSRARRYYAYGGGESSFFRETS
jgi:hypothetical protein